MELVYPTSDDEEATNVANLLKNNGIPAFTTNQHSNTLRKYSMSNIGVFVYVNSQRDEALRVIADPTYNVVNKLDTDQITEINASAPDILQVNNRLLEFLIKPLIILIVLFIIMIIIGLNI